MLSSLGVIYVNLWVAKALMSSYIQYQVFITSGSYSLAELIVLCSFNIQNGSICSSIRNWIAFANNASIVYKVSPVQLSRRV